MKKSIVSIIGIDAAGSEIHERISAEMVAYAAQSGYEMSCHFPADFNRDWFVEVAQSASGAIIGDERFDRELLARIAPPVRAISRYGVGYDQVDLDAATELGVAVSNTPGMNAASVAEQALFLMLATRRRIPLALEALVRATWDVPLGNELDGTVVGLLGFGSVAREVARVLRGFRCRVLAYDVAFDVESASALGVEFRPIDELLSLADIVSLHVAHTPTTERMVDGEFLARMKPSAVLINTARGALVDEDALRDALDRRVIAGAGLDVYQSEPLSNDHWLHGRRDVFLTPHLASNTYESTIRTYRMAVDNVVGCLRGTGCAHLLNPAVLDRDAGSRGATE